MTYANPGNYSQIFGPNSLFGFVNGISGGLVGGGMCISVYFIVLVGTVARATYTGEAQLARYMFINAGFAGAFTAIFLYLGGILGDKTLFIMILIFAVSVFFGWLNE